MYIIQLGQVEVMGGADNNIVLATLCEGSVFGEISLLGIGLNADRRTADVRSKGYANIFVLSKSDWNGVIAYYPHAQAILKKKATALVKKNAAKNNKAAVAKRPVMDADIIFENPSTPPATPKLYKTVLELISHNNIHDLDASDLHEESKNSDYAKTMETVVTIEHERSSPDLLLAIQNELKSKNQNINLTDSEKALMLSTSSISDKSNCE